ncbi:TRAP transporter solute receptor, TAXI family [Clostridium aceticum]|uniref:TRAP transporter solute receptor, TAXI family n=1 Tax=Clostridium aceticum TaxID=84022 RepID=A0A0D8IHP8_9CLOT|nr:TAXI family TRAP transporter solute-binding subunit [Clostridium aceticum]AKL93891.1 TRAP transporter solute receptor, TAXI family [Clostridium aceticum]KJF28716.1 C4-dicarboxylate ABC transporter substrate-binding protein [Clostridium aceticum]
MKKLLVLLLAVALMMVGCGSQSPAGEGEQADRNMFITVATGATSGVYYPIGGAFSNIIEHELGYRSSVQSTGASVENINLLLNNRAELAITMADAVLQAYQGFGAFDGETPKEDLRGLMSLYPNYVQLVTTANSGINTFDDLRGKRVGVGAPNSGVELNARLMLEAHGMSYEDIRPDYLNYGEAIDQIRNGMIDAAFVTSGLPNSTIMDLATTHKIKIIPIEGEGMEYLKENYPFFTSNIIAAGTYDNEEDINTASIMNLMLVDKNLSEEVVYNITKGVFENLEIIHSSHSAAERHIDLESVMEGMVVPLHPGAEKYFKEVGVIE